MNILDYIPDSADLARMSGFSSTQYGSILKRAGEKRLAELREEIEDRARIGAEAVKDDLRHKLGVMAGIKWIMGLERESVDFIKHREKER